MNKVIKEINSNKNLEMNLPIYANYLMNLYNKCAIVEMTMDYYTFYEMLCDSEHRNDKIQAYADELNEIIRDNVFDTKVDIRREKAVAKIDKLRNYVYKAVDILAAYADIFSRYEYVSNRCEYLFKEDEKYDKISDEDLTRDIMQYIFSDEDNAAINSKISEVIAELPLRLTKNKFFQYLSEGLSVYSKTDKATVDDFVYMLKTSALLSIPEDLKEYEELYEIYNDIRNINYSEITEEEFHNLEAKLRYVTDVIDKETNLLMMLQGIINRVYVMILAAPYADNSDKEIVACLDIVKAINDNFNETEYISLPDDITDMFVFLEGVPENIRGKIQNVEYALDTIKSNYLGIVKDIMLDNIYQGLFIAQNLLADSLFVDLSDIQNIFIDDNRMEEQFDTEKYVLEIQDELIKSLTDFFKNNQKPVNRSVMSVVMASLPVFFNNISEVQDYIYNSLSNCTNKAEKQAAIEILKCIINEN
jgi:hypothetical protein